MAESNTSIATFRAPSLITKFADRFGVEPEKMMVTLKATAFKGEVTNEQMMALLIVADQYGLNPWTREIYAFPDKGGIVPVVGVDGWARIINQHPQFDGMSFEQTAEDCTCTIYRKDRAHPITVTEYMSECARPNMAPWKSHPKRMLRHKAMIQCARLAFGFAGIFDPDEAERIIEAEVERKPNAYRPVVNIGPTVSEEQAADLVAYATEVQADQAALLKWLNVESIKDIPAKRYGEVVAMLDRKRQEIAAGE